MSTASVRRFLAALLMTLATTSVHAQAYRNPLVNSATVTAPADISDPTPGNNSSSDSNTLAATAQLSVIKTITTPVPVAAGAPVQYRIEVRNAGPSQAVGATLSDSVPTQLTGVTWTCAPVSAATTCSAASGTGSINVGVNVGVGEVLVVLVNGAAPTVTPATISANSATITAPPGTTDPTPGDNTGTTPTIPVQAAAIVANNDDYSATPVAPGAGGTTPRVFANDTLGGAAFADAAVVATLTTAPAGYAINANGTISVPATAAAGPVALTYQICEAASPSNCASANVALIVSPNAVDDSVAVQAGQAVNADVSSNDNTVAGATFVQAGAAPTQGSVVLQSTGAFTYTANAGATGTDTFAYQLCLPAPNGSVCDTATVTVNLTANVIDAVNDDFSTPAIPAASGGTTSTSVLANDTFNATPVSSANLTTTLITAPAGYTLDAAGLISVPANAVAGPVSLAYRICVTAAPTLCDTASVQLVVAPDAVDDAVTTPGAGQPVSGNVGSNDNTPAGSAFTASGAAPTKGSVTVNAEGSFTYTPAAGATGTDTFGYQVCLPSPAGVCDTALVTVTLGANALMANDDLFPTPVSALTGGSTPSVLGNDTLNGVVVTPGTVTATLQGGVAGYTLDASTGVITVAAGVPAGATALSYQLCENAVPANCSTANVQVLVSPPAQPDTFNVQSGQAVNGNVGTNDAPPTGAVFAALTQPTVGTLVFNDDGTFTYTSPAGSTGSNSFTYQVCLPAPNSAVCASTTATLVIAANTVDAVDDPFSTPAISPVTGGSTPSVLGNDLYNGAPAAAAQVTLSLVNAPPPGYTITSAGVINVPAGAAAGAVSLTYELCEAGTTSNCDTAQVALLIAPAAANDTYTTPAGQPLPGDVSLNDNAPAGSTYSVLTPPAAGSFVLQADGTFVYTPAGAGAQTLQYQVCLPAPDAGTCATGTVNITVIANTLDALDDNFRTPAFAPGVGGSTPSVLGNDTFNGAAANPLQVTVNLVGAPTGFSMDAAGVINVASFAPAGATTLTYQLCELGSTTNCDTAAVQVLIAPDALDDSVAVTGTQPGSFNLAANDNVPAGATFTVTLAPTKGTGVLAADGTLQYTATAGQSGADTLTYQVCLPSPDGAVCDSAQVAISIAAAALVAVNDDYSASPIPPAGGSTPSVLLNDTFNGAAIVPGTTPVTASLTTLVSGYSMAANGVVSVAAGTPPGSVALNYQVCETALPGNCAAATAVVVMSPDAVNDVLPATAGATTVLNVLANDLAPVSPVVTITVVPVGGNAVVNADGSLSYTPTGPFVGQDSLTYQLCLPAPHGTVCDTATVAITVTATTLTAANDNYTATPIAPAAGGSTASVLLNDTFNGAAIVPGTTPVTATLLNAVPGYTMAPTGVITVAAGTTPAAVTLGYQVCETALPTNCAAATAVVAVSPDAVDDALPATAGTSTVLNVLANDAAPLNPVVSIVGAPANGTAVANGDGTIRYTPNGAYTGADSFTYQLCLPAPGAGVCDTATVAVTVSATTLTASNDDFTATPVTPATGGSTPSVLLNDSFSGAPIVPGTTPVTATLSTPVTGYSMAPNGVITVAAGTTPAAVTLNYQVCENAVPTNCAGATAVVAVSPDAVADALPATAGTTTVLNVLANDTAPVNPTVSIAVAPTNGAATVNGDGTVSYTPTAGFTGPDTFTYQLCLPAPGAAVCDTATVNVTVGTSSITATADDFTGTPVAPAAGGTTASVLLNDTFNGAPIVPGTTAVSATLLTPVTGYSMDANGVITVAPGTVPAAVTLNYQVCENAVPTNCAGSSVVVAVSPDAADDALPATAGTTTVFNVLANDTVPTNPTVTVSVAPGNGSAVANPDGTISYTPTPGYTGPDTLTYQVCLPAPGAAVCDTATLTITVSATTLAATADDFTAAPIAPASGGSTASVLLNDTFNGAPIVPGTTPVAASLVTPVAGYSIAPDGVVTVAAGTSPAATTLNYQVCEVAVPTNCAQSTAVVAVSPVVVDDTLNAAAGATTVLSVTSNDTLPATPTLSLPVAPTNGTAVFNPDGTISYTPNAGYTGPDSFTYQACLPAPAAAVCDTATVTLTIAATSVAATNDDFTAAPIAPSTGGTTASVLLNDTFNGAPIVPGTTPVTATLLAPVAGYGMGANGVVTVAPGTTPAATTLGYQVCETAVPTNCAQAAAVVAVSPVAADDTLSAGAGATTVLNVTANDTLPLNPVITVPAAPTNGTVVVNGDNTISYTPNAGFSGSDTFTYQVCLPAPGASVCDTASVSLTVSATSLAAVGDDFSGTPIAPAAGGNTPSVLLNDTFNGAPIVPGTTPVTATLVTPVAGYSIAPTGVVTVAPGTPPSAATLAYQVCENAQPTNCAQATALVAVRPDAIDDSLAAGAGTTVLNVAANDTLPANPVITVLAPPSNGVALVNGDNTISYTPNAGFTGNDSFTYQACLPAPNLNVCDTASVAVAVTASTLDAVDDTLTNVPATGTLGVVNVLANDTFNGAALDPATVQLTPNNTTALTIQPNGSLDVAAGTPGVTYTTTYRICQVAQPAVCDIGTVSVTLASTPGLLDAVDDTVANVPVTGGAGVANVLTNDTYNNAALDPTTVVLTPANTAAITIQPDGSVDVAAGTPGTTYTTTYQICLVTQPAVCDVGTVSVTLANAGVVVAADDNVPDAPPGGGSGLGNVLDNDTRDGAPVDPSTVVLTPVNTPALTIQPDGSVTVAPGTPGTTYTTTYQICLVAQPTVCDTGTLSVTLAAAPNAMPVASDDQATTPQGVAVDVPVLANDVANGTPINPDDVVVTVSAAPTMGTASVLPNARLRYVPMTNFSGTDSFTYSVCSEATPENCSSATVTVQTGPNDVDVVDENITVLSGTTTTVPLLDNLTTSGATINPASMRLGRAASSGRATCANGDCVYTAFVGYSGLDNFSYNICDRSLPTPVCVEGWVNVVVTADTIVLRLTKQATQRSVQVGDVVRYVVTVENMGDVDALGATLYDTLPSGFTFIPGSLEVQDADNAARASGIAPLRIDGVDIPAGGSATLVYYLRVGAGVGVGIHTNRITANDVLGTTISNVASADVEVIGDPLLDESLVIGSVFDDRNGNGAQDPGERGIPGVRVVSVEGLVIETDAWGRYHLVGINGGQARGRNFILKVDPTTLPAEARFTTRNPLVRRITPGLPVRFDFGVAMPEGQLGEGPPTRPQQVLEVGEALFVAGQATLGAAAEAVLAHAASTLQAQGGGRVNVAKGQATPALAGQRAEALRNALLPRLPADVAAHVQVQVQPAAPDRPATRADR